MEPWGRKKVNADSTRKKKENMKMQGLVKSCTSNFNSSDRGGVVGAVVGWDGSRPSQHLWWMSARLLLQARAMTRHITLASKSRRAEDSGCFTLISQSIWKVIHEGLVNYHEEYRRAALIFLPPRHEELIDVV